MIDPHGNKRQLLQRSASELYIHDLPVILECVSPDRIVIKGAKLTTRWTETELAFERITISQ